MSASFSVNATPIFKQKLRAALSTVNPFEPDRPMIHIVKKQGKNFFVIRPTCKLEDEKHYLQIFSSGKWTTHRWSTDVYSKEYNSRIKHGDVFFRLGLKYRIGEEIKYGRAVSFEENTQLMDFNHVSFGGSCNQIQPDLEVIYDDQVVGVLKHKFFYKQFYIRFY